MGRVTTIEEAAAWVDRVGLALLFPKADAVLPSLLAAVSGPGAPTSIRDPDGSFVSWGPGMDKVWSWKSELPDRKLACGGKHLARVASFVAPRLVPALVASHGEVELSELHAEIVGVVREEGPLSGPDLRRLLGAETKRISAAVEWLQRELVLTNVGLVEQEQGWPAVTVDLLTRRWEVGALPDRDEARRTVAGIVLRAAGEVSAADVSGIFGWRRKEAAAVLDELPAKSREEAGVRLWTAPKL